MKTVNDMNDINILNELDQEIFSVLSNKFKEYDRFHNENPALGGFLPWVEVNAESGQMHRAHNEEAYKLPSLDNGQLTWSLISLSQSLSRLSNSDLFVSVHKKCDEIIGRQLSSIQTIFVNDFHYIRQCVIVEDPKDADITPSNYSTQTYTTTIDGNKVERSSILSDPYEGELLIMLLDLCCDWNKINNVCNLYWNDDKRYRKEFLAHFPIYLDDGPSKSRITVERGSYFSSHEQWKVMVLPYLKHCDNYLNIFKNNEIARTHHSVACRIKGLFATANAFRTDSNGKKKEIVLPFGIDILSLPMNGRNMLELATAGDVFVAPYATFPLFMIDPCKAISWHHLMLNIEDMNTEYGTLESTHITSNQPHDALTWDGKMTTMLAVCGGTCDLIDEWLHANNKIETFKSRLSGRFDNIHNDLLSPRSNFPQSPTDIISPKSHFNQLTELDIAMPLDDCIYQEVTWTPLSTIPQNEQFHNVTLKYNDCYIKVKPNKLLPGITFTKQETEAQSFNIVHIVTNVVFIVTQDGLKVMSATGNGGITLREKKCGWDEMFVMKCADENKFTFESRHGYLGLEKCNNQLTKFELNKCS
ncbi:CAZyme family protein [Acrasis kona]|uniref:CAZyme family protein n=1 Tax=Acrasis kona TaxID=1008807 RepID=A0AAW2YIX6_9EUKA